MNNIPTLLLSALLFSACVADVSPTGPGEDPSAPRPPGSDDPGGPGDDDPSTPPDSQACATGPQYLAINDGEAELITDEDGDTYYEFYGELSSSPVNEIEISLWDGLGVFEADDIGPGTFTISGDDTSWEDCGLCVVIYGDVDPVTEDERQVFIAQSGTVVLDSVAGTMSGSLDNVLLKQIDPVTEAVIPGGCETTVSGTFSAAVE